MLCGHLCVSMWFCGALQVVYYTTQIMVQTVLFVQLNSNTLFHMPVIRFSSLRWDKAVQELMCGQAPLPCAQQLAHCTITQSPCMLQCYHLLCSKSFCWQTVIVQLVNKEQNCKYLCIISIHECSGRFLNTVPYILGHNLHTAVKEQFPSHTVQTVALFPQQYCMG